MRSAEIIEPLMIGGSKHPEAYRLIIGCLPQPLFVIGSYVNTCGGCDGISTQDEICDRVRRFAALGHVALEGLLMSHLFSRYAALAHELAPTRFIWAFLDTPLELCLARVQARRDARGVAKRPLNPSNTTAKWHNMRKVYAKCQAVGLDARWLDHNAAAEQVLTWLRAA